MKIISLEEKRIQKAMEEMVVLPVYDSIFINDNGELVGEIVAYKEMPKYLLEDGDLYWQALKSTKQRTVKNGCLKLEHFMIR